jgi:carbonic anhydrase
MLSSVLALLLAVPALASDDHGHAPVSKTNGWEALSTLQTGNMRFYEGHPKHPNIDGKRREEVAGGQKPHTIVISCSDSRVPPEEVFDQGLGDVFTIRNAGNVMSPESIASAEYAIEHLGARFLVVMGHESCGAVGAAISAVPGQSVGSPSLDTLISQVRVSQAAKAAAASDKTFRHGVKENVAAQLAELLKKSAIVREAVASKGLVLGQAIYSLRSGRVEFWDVGKTAGAPVAAPEGVVIHEPTVKEEVIQPDPVPAKAAKKAPAKKSATPKALPKANAPEAASGHDAHHH